MAPKDWPLQRWTSDLGRKSRRKRMAAALASGQLRDFSADDALRRAMEIERQTREDARLRMEAGGVRRGSKRRRVLPGNPGGPRLEADRLAAISRRQLARWRSGS